MNNLVLGSSGFVGRYFCTYLKQKGEKVVEYDLIHSSLEDGRFNHLPLKGIDRVYFLAWNVGGSNYLYDPKTQQGQLDWNLKLLSNILPQLKKVPFVFVSSQLAEDCDTVYGVLKRLGEVWTGLSENGRVVRFWNVYGAYEDRTIKSHVVADFIHQALSNNYIKIQTNGNESRQFVYIDDICEALHKSFDHKGVFDISSLKWNTIYEVAQLISEYTGCSIIRGEKQGTSLFIENKPVFHQTKVSLDDGLQKTIELFRSMNKS
jgi:nucleoside-diphosphate-sugar epimerase